MNRLTAVGLTALVALVVAACAGDPGDEMAQAACRGYAASPPDRTTVDERAKRAEEANESYASLRQDIDDAWSRKDAIAATHNSGGQVSAGDLNAYFAADKQVRADCADAGEDLGPLKP